MASTDRNKLQFLTTNCCCYWLLIGFIVITATTTTTKTSVLGSPVQQQQQPQPQTPAITDNAVTPQDPATPGISVLSPRVDYNNEWRPVGRGDPLKNDPTYDYSPPALERVRYWAETADQKDEHNMNSSAKGSGSTAESAAVRAKHPEALLLGIRSGNPNPQQHMLKNAKGEVPLVQPKYTSIRRSYYAAAAAAAAAAANHQLPTHLMPPPMHQSHHMMKPQVSGEYRHGSMHASQYQQQQQQQYQQQSGSSATPAYMNSAGPSTTMSMTTTHQHHNQHMLMSSTRPHYTSTLTSSPSSSSSTMPWLHASAVHHHMPAHMYDAHYQESMNYPSYTRPSAMSASMSYSPNAIHPNANRHTGGMKHSASPRKPWLHELLQKEVVKSVRPTMPATKYLMGTTKPYYDSVNSFVGISTTYPPVSFVTPTTPAAIKPHPSMYAYTTMSNGGHQHQMQTASLGPITTTPVPYPIFPTIFPTVSSTARTTTTSTTTTTTTPRSVPSSTSSRLLIPETSNLAYRPTVAPMAMTTDSLFKHYNQPDKPLKGPMYLIIEGHSKVKTYGKNDLDPHQPKIVPVISKREPVVRIADPNEKRGTVETFQVKHLHTKTTPTTTPKPTVPMQKDSATLKTTTTKRPAVTTVKATIATTTAKTTTSKPTTTTAKTTTSKPSTTPTTTTSRPASSSSTTTTAKPLTDLRPNPKEQQPPTGMQGLLSLLDESFGDIFKDDAMPMPDYAAPKSTATGSTILQPVASGQLENPQIQPRISTKADSIISAIDDDDDDEYDNVSAATTEPVPREIRQVFDYDQLPESRRKELFEAGLIDDDEDAEAWLKSAYADGNEAEEMTDDAEEDDDEDYEESDGGQQLMKRIDKLMSDEDDDGVLVGDADEFEDMDIADGMDTFLGDDDVDDDEMEFRSADSVKLNTAEPPKTTKLTMVTMAKRMA